jgi:hypothetical protein
VRASELLLDAFADYKQQTSVRAHGKLRLGPHAR